MQQAINNNPSDMIFIGKNSSETLSVPQFLGVNSHTHPFWEMVIYVEGEGEGVIDGVKYKFKQGTAVAIPPNKIHSEVGAGNYVTYYVYFPMLVAESNTIFSSDSSGNLIKLADVLYDVYSRKEDNYPSLSNSIAFTIFEYIKGVREQANMSAHTRIFTKLIRENLSNVAFSLPAEAEEYGITMHHLRYCFERDLGKTPLEYLTELRLERARQLIISGMLRVKDVSRQCGYADCYYFSRSFKKQYGIAPETFYQQINQGKKEPSKQK